MVMSSTRVTASTLVSAVPVKEVTVAVTVRVLIAVESGFDWEHSSSRHAAPSLFLSHLPADSAIRRPSLGFLSADVVVRVSSGELSNVA